MIVKVDGLRLSKSTAAAVAVGGRRRLLRARRQRLKHQDG